MEKAVLLADDHVTVRRGVEVLCERHLGIKEFGNAASCSEILMRLKRKRYSHLILDLIFPDGISLEIIPTIRGLYPKLRIGIFSMQSEDIYKNALNSYGIYDFMSKDAPEQETVKALRRFIFDERPAKNLRPIDKNSTLMDLAPREVEVMYYLINGVKQSVIAKTLNLKKQTVSTIKYRIFEKGNVNNLIELKELASISIPPKKQRQK